MTEEETVRLIGELFVARRDCHCVQTQHGYVKIDEPLTDDILREHVQGKKTLGSYQLTKDSHVKWLCFDFDPEKLHDPKEAVLKVLKVCSEEKGDTDGKKTPRIFPKAILLEASRFPDPSYHVWVLFQPDVPAKVAHWLGLRMLELGSLNPKEVEVFPKQTELSVDRPFGNFVKLPCGFHQVEKKWSRFLDPSTFEPLSLSILSDVQGINFLESDLKEIEAFEEKRHVQVTFTLPQEREPLKDKEEERIARFLAKYWRQPTPDNKSGNRNYLEMAFLGWAIKKGIPFESAYRIVEQVTTLTSDEEREQRLQLVRYHYQNRRNIGSNLLGISGLKEVIGETLTEGLTT